MSGAGRATFLAMCLCTSMRVAWAQNLPLVPWEESSIASHEEHMRSVETARAWAKDARDQAAAMSEQAELIRDKMIRWAGEASRHVKTAQRAASEASLACFQAVATARCMITSPLILTTGAQADHYGPQPQHVRLKTEVRLRELVVKAVDYAGKEAQGTISQAAGEEAAQDIAATAVEAAASDLHVTDAAMQAAAFKAIFQQIVTAATRAARQVAASTRARGVVLHVAEAAANDGVRAITLTDSASDTAVMYAAREEAREAAVKAVRIICRDAARDAAHQAVDGLATPALLHAVVEVAVDNAHAQLQHILDAVKQNVTNIAQEVALEAGIVLASEAKKLGLDPPDPATQAANYGAEIVPVENMALNAAMATARAVVRATRESLATAATKAVAVARSSGESVQNAAQAAVAQIMHRQEPFILSKGAGAAKEAASIEAESRLREPTIITLSAMLTKQAISGLHLKQIATAATPQITTLTTVVQAVIAEEEDIIGLQPEKQDEIRHEGLRAALEAVHKEVTNLNVQALQRIAQLAAQNSTTNIVRVQLKNEEYGDISRTASLNAQEVGTQAVEDYINTTAIKMAEQEAREKIHDMVGSDMVHQAVTTAFKQLSTKIATNVSALIVQHETKQAVENAIDALPAELRHGEDARVQAESAAEMLTKTATLVAVQRSLSAGPKQAAFTAAKAAFRVASTDIQGNNVWTAVFSAALRALDDAGETAARAAAEAAAQQVVNKVVGLVTDKTARLAAVNDVVTAAIDGIDKAAVRVAASDALMAAATAQAERETPPVCTALGITSTDGVQHAQKDIAEAIFDKLLKTYIADVTDAGLKAAKKAAQNAAWSVLTKSANEAGVQEGSIAAETNNAAREAAMVAAKSTAQYLANSVLRKHGVHLTISEMIDEEGRSILTQMVLTKAKNNLATEISEATVAQAMKDIIPLTSENAMNHAIAALGAAGQQDSAYITQALQSAEGTLVTGMEDAARQASIKAARDSVTEKAHAMVRAAVDQAIVLSRSGTVADTASTIAEAAAVKTVHHTCYEPAMTAARTASEKAVQTIADSMAETELQQAIQLLKSTDTHSYLTAAVQN